MVNAETTVKMITIFSPCSGKVFLTSSRSSVSLFLCLPNCLGSKPVYCSVRFSSLFIFPLMLSPLCLDFFPSSHDKQSAFLIRLGKYKTSSWLHLRKGNVHLIKYPPAEELNWRQTTRLRNLSSSLVLYFSFCVAHTPDNIYTVTLIVRITEIVGPKVVI